MENTYEKLIEFASIQGFYLGDYLVMLFKILIIVIMAKIFTGILNRLIVNFFRVYPKFKADEKKVNTLTGILKSVIKYTVYTVMGISILNVIGIPTQAVIATAGLGGIAIGFGAQSLVRDVFSGFFILFEDQYGVGDYVTIGAMTGTVEDMGLRITKIRSFNGDLHIIPNGEIKTVTNHSRGNSLAIIDVKTAYEADQEKAVDILKSVIQQYYDKHRDMIVSDPEVLGIISLAESEVVIRSIIAVKPLLHWKVEREVRKLVLDAFKHNGIEIPYPRRIYVNKEQT